jgi:MFS family permease
MLLSPAAEVERRPEPTDPFDAGTASARASTFSSLRIRSYRLFAAGQAFSNIGTWVQRTAQDWLVLGLTGSATSVGLATTLQLGPTVLLGLLGGLVADRYPKRRILLCTQTTMASLAALLSLLALSHHLQVWAVYLVALALGIVAAIDKPAQQSFVTEMVGPRDLRNAVSLNSSLWQLGALTGPAVSGILMNAVGVGYAFAINAASFVPPIIALWLIRDADLNIAPAPLRRGHAEARHAVLYAVHRPNILWSTVLAGVVGLFTINLPVTLSAYAKDILHSGAGGYALLSTAVAIGSFAGALISARRPLTRLRSIIAAAVALSVTLIVAALVTGESAFALALMLVGAASVIVLASTSSTIQLSSDGLMRGRVVGAYLIVFVGSGALGGPVVGEMDQVLGPRIGMLISGVVLASATILIGWTLAQTNRLRVQLRTPRAGTRFIGIVSR